MCILSADDVKARRLSCQEVEKDLMRALFYPAWGALELRDIPRPSLVGGEVLVRVSNCGICSSELETFRTKSVRRTPPLIMGHEFCGYIAETNGTPGGWKEGDKVIAHALIHCGKCGACLRGDTNLCVDRKVFGMHRAGAFAEYVAVPGQVLIPWSDKTPGTTAVLAEPLATGINAMRQGPGMRKSRVVVIGCGPIGLMCVFAAKRLHNSNVVASDMIPERVDAARLMGADLAVNAERQNIEREIAKHWSGDKAEFVIDAVGSARTKQLSLELIDSGGMAVWLGLEEDRIVLNSYALTLGQKLVTGTYSGSLNDFQQAAQLLASGALDTRWITEYSLADADTAFHAMLSGKGTSIKAILQIGEPLSKS
jgi:threonine dehydrogenase-like Zn-dependent dehydrogenase